MSLRFSPRGGAREAEWEQPWCRHQPAGGPIRNCGGALVLQGQNVLELPRITVGPQLLIRGGMD